MNKGIAIIVGFLFSLVITAQQPPSVYVDQKGIMRWEDTKREVSFFGVNYTLPFAHAYRAAGYLGVDRKRAIDQDVYHFARLGFNAYRIHIWDVEISDEHGNLIQNDHLDLLDYLFAKLRERNIYIMITAQTNFGNGYPERNQKTNGFSYLYDKCDIHANPMAIAAQEQYLKGLVNHVNPYTRLSYKDDPMVIGFEINNEPCHKGTPEQTKQYIDRMLLALKQAGNRKPIFYNVSRNMDHVASYYDTKIQGTTFQWYPTGLVSGHTRDENYLPNVDQYDIPFSSVKGFNNKAKLVYEFDPADILGSYLYPATVRSFRSAGFQWITQFAYDPISLAHANSEYQTHYLNLAYTPGKAISMKIAAQAAYTLPLNKKYGFYPDNSAFDDFRVSYAQDLSEYNSFTMFYHSNNTLSTPKDATQLQSVAGVGQSPIVDYPGSGAYFIDKLEDGLWRLEVMPDVIRAADPFGKPSLERDVMRIYNGKWDMAVNLPNLGKSFTITGINSGNMFSSSTTDGVIRALYPGAYLLNRLNSKPMQDWNANSMFNNFRLGEFVAPLASQVPFTIDHEPVKICNRSRPLTIDAIIGGHSRPDSVLIYTDRVSFWNERNPYFKMSCLRGNLYQAVVPAGELTGDQFNYNIVIFCQNQRFTAPSMVKQSPLDWNYINPQYFTTQINQSDATLKLFSVTDAYSGLDCYELPEWKSTQREVVDMGPTAKNMLRLSVEAGTDRVFLRKNVSDVIKSCSDALPSFKYLCIRLKEKQGVLMVGVVTSEGITYRAKAEIDANGISRLLLSSLQQSETALLPVAYPLFMKQYFTASETTVLQLSQIQSLELMLDADRQAVSLQIGDIWME